MKDDIKNIVVLGAGFGGIRSAILLQRSLKRHSLLKRYRILLIDKVNYHTYTPLLYELASMPPNEKCTKAVEDLSVYPISKLVKKLHISFLCAEVTSIDVKTRHIHTKSSRIQFSYLILALGSEVNFFNIPGAKENSLTLKTAQDAYAIRRELHHRDSRLHKKPVRIVIGGGGPTGTELASEIKNWFPSYDVTIVESSSAIVGNFDNSVQKKIANRLSQLDISVKTSWTIARVEKDRLISKTKESLPFHTFIWTAGVKATTLTNHLQGNKHRDGRVIISHGLSCVPENKEMEAYSRVYVVGDMGCVLSSNSGVPTPMLARVAIDQAEIASHNIIESVLSNEFSHKPHIRLFKTQNSYSYIIPVGGKWALAKIGGFTIEGYIGWLIKGLVEIRYLIHIMPFWSALRIWVRGFIFFACSRKLG